MNVFRDAYSASDIGREVLSAIIFPKRILYLHKKTKQLSTLASIYTYIYVNFS